MQDNGEWLSEIRELVEGDWQFKEPNLVAENEDVLVFNHIVLDDGQKFRVTAVNFLKDGQMVFFILVITQVNLQHIMPILLKNFLRTRNLN